jgi:HSP20 family protein
MDEKKQDVAVQRPSDAMPQRFDQQVERLFDDFFRRRWPRPFSFEWPSFAGASGSESAMPRIDVIDKEDHLLVRAELPGMTKDDIEVSVTANAVMLKGSTQREEKSGEGEYHRREIYSASVARTIALPTEVDADSATAALKDGILEVKVPKSSRAARRRIEIAS